LKKNSKFKFKDIKKFNQIKKIYLYKKNKKVAGGLRLQGIFRKNFYKFPLITIIMPNFKSKILTKSIKSVLDQKYPNIELIVVDGNSGNSTIKILKKFNNKIDFWLSEDDKGLWDAWNKGFNLSSGKFVGIVDSSNTLYPNAMKILAKYIIKNKKIDFICGTVKKDGRLYGGYNPKDIYKKFNVIPSSVVGFFIKKSALKKVGFLNLKYNIQSDYDLLYRMIVIHKLKGMHTKGNEIFGDLGDSGFSKKHNYLKTLFNEAKIRFNNKQNIFVIFYILIGRTVKKIIH
jgi:glycosyltransferase involved in cell wall biosynthesis